MKHIQYLAAFLTITAISVFAQEEGGGSSVTYLSTTTNMITSFAPLGGSCIPSRMAFDFEPVNGDIMFDVDLMLGKTEYAITMSYQGKQRYNNGSGDFLNDDGTFFNTTSACPTDETINGIIFGKLRPTNTRRDLAVLRQNEIRIYYNTGNGMATSANQTISVGAKNGFWAPFVAGDNYEDLVVSDGSQVRAYRNLTNGNLDLSPYTFSITASKIIVAQMDEDIYKRDFDTRFDLVSSSLSQLSVRLNNNNNGFASTQTFDVGFNISGIAVGDIDNNGFNDVVVGGFSVAKVYLNSNGSINTIPHWSATNFINSDAIPLVGDMGTPTDPNRNDGWNDILFTGYEAVVRIFANNQGTFNSTPEQSFISGPHFSVTSNPMLADIQNTGGLSFAYTSIHSHIGNPSVMIHTNKHTGNPAPAPPKGVSVVATPPDQYGYRFPKVSWAPNTERDISSYELWRKITGICGNGTWYLLAPNITSTDYTDLSIGTVGSGSDCTAHYKLKAKDIAGNASDFSGSVSIAFGSSQFKVGEGTGGKLKTNLPADFTLQDAFPNPFNPSTQIRFELPEDGFVALNVFDALGRKVGELANGNYAAGYHSVTWNVPQSGIASGVYFARFTAIPQGGTNGAVRFSKINKLMLAK